MPWATLRALRHKDRLTAAQTEHSAVSRCGSPWQPRWEALCTKTWYFRLPSREQLTAKNLSEPPAFHALQWDVLKHGFSSVFTAPDQLNVLRPDVWNRRK